MAQPYCSIIFPVRVDRTHTAAQVIKATGRTQPVIDKEVLREMPLKGRIKDYVNFFELDYDPAPDELDHEYKVRGLGPDPVAVTQAMTNDPAFADEQPVVVQWRDGQDRACCMIFDSSIHGRNVYVYRHVNRWLRHHRFAGVPK